MSRANRHVSHSLSLLLDGVCFSYADCQDGGCLSFPEGLAATPYLDFLGWLRVLPRFGGREEVFCTPRDPALDLDSNSWDALDTSRLTPWCASH